MENLTCRATCVFHEHPRWDSNGDGTLSFEEIFAPGGLLGYVAAHWCTGRPRELEPPPLQNGAAWFDFWDSDRDGTLDKTELHRALVKSTRLNARRASLPCFGWCGF